MSSALKSSLFDFLVATKNPRKVRIEGREKTLMQVLPRQQARPSIHFPQRRTMNMDLPSAPFNNNRQPFTVTIRKTDIDKLGHIKAKLTFAVVGSAVLPPMTHVFDRIEVRTAGDNAQCAATFPEVMMSNFLSQCSKGRQRALFQDINIDSSEDGFLGTTAPLTSGNHSFYLPLFFGGFFENFDLYLADSKVDLNFVFYPAANLVVSGSGTAELVGMQFIVESDKLNDTEREAYRLMYSQYARECYFLDPLISPYNNRTLTAGTTNYFNLSSVNGLVSHHLILFRATGASNVGNTNWRYLNIGNSSTVDLHDPANQSLYGVGSAVPAPYLRTNSIDSMDSDWVVTTPAYYLSYADNFSQALHGNINGARWFDGRDDQIAVTLGPAGVNEVQTITPSGAIASGNYRLLYKQQLSAELAYNATPSQMSAAFAAIKSAAARFVTCTFSQALSAGGAVTATFTHPQNNGLGGDLLEIVGNGIPSCATVRTTPGTAGLATGSYDVQIISYIYKRGTYINGRLRSDTLLPQEA